MFSCAYVSIYICTHIYIYIHTYVHMYIYIYMNYICVCMCVNIHTYIYIHIHMHMRMCGGSTALSPKRTRGPHALSRAQPSGAPAAKSQGGVC